MKEALVRIAVLLSIIVMLFPILLGGIAGMQQHYRTRWKAMREEHLRCIAIDRERLALKRQHDEQSSSSKSRTKNP